MSVTIKDVAKRAGFSVATVSRVLNAKALVRAETRRRVEAAAAELRYTPNRAARSLITRKTHTLGIVLPGLYGEFFSEILRGIDAMARRHDYHLLVSGSHNRQGEIAAAVEAMHGRVDGLLVMSPGIDAVDLASRLPGSLPVVLLNGDPGNGIFDAIKIDNQGSARAMVRHLIGNGHRRVAIIQGDPGNADAIERLAGYRAALAESGTSPEEGWELAGNFTERSGHRAAQAILELRPRPTAVFAANDAMAIGAMAALREAGVRVPAEMAVAGFDDIPISRYTSPSLTSVRVPIRRLGTCAMEWLIEALENGSDRARHGVTLHPRVVIRESSGGRVAGRSHGQARTP